MFFILYSIGIDSNSGNNIHRPSIPRVDTNSFGVQEMVTALFKVVLMGDGSVGKTSLRRTYMGEGFRANYMITIGADFAVKKMQLHGGHDVSIQIWDLAGQEHFKSVRS
ncbi:MAG: hypothetical protein C4K48_00480, partial [Candidatus Thorarchaeota archaeon]